MAKGWHRCADNIHMLKIIFLFALSKLKQDVDKIINAVNPRSQDVKLGDPIFQGHHQLPSKFKQVQPGTTSEMN